VVVGAHWDISLPEEGEGGVVVERGAVLGVDIEEIQDAGAVGEGGLDAAEKRLEDGILEGVEEEDEGGGEG
jgi:hypothetical protein